MKRLYGEILLILLGQTLIVLHGRVTRFARAVDDITLFTYVSLFPLTLLEPPHQPLLMLSRHIRIALTLQPRRFFYASAPLTSNSRAAHRPDSYNKDIDSTPPSDSTIHRVDPTSDSVQKPHEAPSGEWSRAGTRTSEYQSVDKAGKPYAAPEEDRKYGGKELYAKGKSPETSKPSEGPEGKASGGRKLGSR